MKKKMESWLYTVMFFSLSITEKSGKGLEMQHQEVKSHCLLTPHRGWRVGGERQPSLLLRAPAA